MTRMPEPHELNKDDPRNPFFDDGYRPRVQPKFIRELNPDHLKPRQPLRNPNRNRKNPSPLKELQNLQNSIFYRQESKENGNAE